MGSWVGHLQTCGSEPPEHRGDAGQAPAAGTWAPRSRVLGKWSPGAHLGRGCVPPPRAASQALQHAFGAALLERKAEPVPRMLPCPSHLDLPLLQTPCAGSAAMEVPGRLALPCPMPCSLPGLQKVVWELAGRSLRLQLWRWRLPWLSAGSAQCVWGFVGRDTTPGTFDQDGVESVRESEETVTARPFRQVPVGFAVGSREEGF